jgi:hypothetical protein
LQALLTAPDSITGAYLSGRQRIATPPERRKGNGRHLILRDCHHNNLQHFDLEIPETPTSDVASLFDLRQAEEVSLVDCSVTIRSQGTTAGTIALFEVRAGLSSSIMRMKEPRVAIEPTDWPASLNSNSSGSAAPA